MIKYIITKKFIFFIVLLNFSFAKAQDLEWWGHFTGSADPANTANNNYDDELSTALAIDGSGNNYILSTSDSVAFDMDPTEGVSMVENIDAGSGVAKTSLYLTKLDVDGAYIWGTTFYPESYHDKAIDMKIGSDGLLYILSMTNTYTLNSPTVQNHITITKVDLDGNILLTKKLTNTNQPSSYDIFSAVSMDLDSANNIYIVGYYKFLMQFEPDNPTMHLSTGYKDSFLIKLNSGGTLLWTRDFGVDYTNTHFERVKVNLDGSLSVLISNGDNQSLPSYGYDLYKVNASDGLTIWKKYFDKQIPVALAVDNFGNILISGRGNSSNGTDIDVDPSDETFFVSSPTIRYLLYLTSSGTLIDVKKFSTQSYFNALNIDKIEVDSDNNVFLIGWFTGIFDTDPSEDVFLIQYLVNCVSRESFCIKLDAERNFDLAFQLGNYQNDCSALGISDIKSFEGSINLIGSFSQIVDINPSASITLLNCPFGTVDSYIIKLNSCTSTAPVGSSNQSFCSSNARVENLTPNSSSINWYDSAVSTTVLDDNTVLLNGQTYYASKQSGSCPESDRLPVTVTIATSPSVPTTSNQMFCENELATIANLIITGQNVKWYTSETTSNEILATTLLQNNTNYYATQTVNGCESARKVINVTVNSVGIPGVVSPQVFCKQDNATLNEVIVSGQNIKWYDAATAGTLLPNATLLVDGTTYYVSQTINGCESERVAVTVTVHETVAPSGIAVQTFCNTQVLTLADFMVTGTDLKFYDAVAGGNLLPITTSLVHGLTYYASQTLNGCESILRLALVPDIISGVPANGYAEMMCDDLDDGLEVVDLSNYNGNLIANAGTYTFKYYTNLTNAENETAGTHVTNFSNYPLSTGLNTIYVRVMFANSCYEVVALELTVVALPQLNMKDTYAVCENGFVTITADAGFDSYSWSSGEMTQSITVTNGGNYDVTVTKNTNGLVCSSTKSITVEVSERAMITAVETVDWTSSENVITVYVDGSGVYEYSVDGVNFQTSNQFYELPNGEYTVYVNDIKGCGIAKKEVYLLMYPKYFTPNGDSYNDFWGIEYYQNEVNLVVKIFDRYGKFIKQLTANDPVWNGTYNGYELPSTDYWFTVIRQDGTEYKGHFTLKR